MTAFGAFEPVQGVVEVPGFFTPVPDAVDITKAVVAVVPLDQHLKGSDCRDGNLTRWNNRPGSAAHPLTLTFLMQNILSPTYEL